MQYIVKAPSSSFKLIGVKLSSPLPPNIKCTCACMAGFTNASICNSIGNKCLIVRNGGGSGLGRPIPTRRGWKVPASVPAECFEF